MPNVFGGFATLQNGMNGALAPSLIAPTQVAAAVNLTMRDGFIKTRPPWKNILIKFDSTQTAIRFSGKFQGAIFYESDFGQDQFILARGGRLFRIILGLVNVLSEITPPDGLGGFDENPNWYDLMQMFCAENYVIIMGGQHRPLIYDGVSVRRAGIGELPSGWFGIYLWGRIWIVLPDRRSLVAGDIVYGPSGTAANGFRDAILKMTENDFLNEGGSFAVPSNAGPITSLFTLATVDTSLGVGNLLVGTTNMVCSMNTPPDRTTWKNLTFPIQTVSLLDEGPQGPRYTVSVNGDEWYRSGNGIRSFQVAREDMGNWGQTPMSREVSPILDFDTKELLIYGSAIKFDNKVFGTVSPRRSSNGILHQGLVILNFDLLSTMGGKSPPAWEGAYSGLDFLQVVRANTAQGERGFVFAYDADNLADIELWEMQRTGTRDELIMDSGAQSLVAQPSSPPAFPIAPVIFPFDIQSWFHTRSDDMGDASQLKKLTTAELFLDEIVDTVTVVVKFKPDQYPNWTTWQSISVCQTVSQCAPPADCSVRSNKGRGYAARIMLPAAPEDCNELSSRPINWGYEFQFRLEITGYCRIRRFKSYGMPQTDNQEGSCPPDAVCQTITACGDPWFTYKTNLAT